MSVPMYRQFSITWSSLGGNWSTDSARRSGLFQGGSVAIDFGLQLPAASGSLTEGPINPNHDQFDPKYVRLSSYPDDRGLNPCG